MYVPSLNSRSLSAAAITVHGNQDTLPIVAIANLPVDRIAAEVGFATGASLRQHLHEAIGVAPLVYRRMFRAAAQAAAS
jgi:hypothetical protein